MRRSVSFIGWFVVVALVAAAVRMVGPVHAADPPVSSARPKHPSGTQTRDIGSLIKQLDSDNYHSRQRANMELAKLGRQVIPDVVSAAGGESLEVTIRAIEVLKKLGMSDDLITEDAAYTALSKLALAKPGVVSGQARRALGSLKDGQHDRTIARIKRLGGVVTVGYNNLQANVLIAGPRGIVMQSSSGEPISISIGSKWKGGREGLSLFRRLRSLPSLSLEGEQITDKWLQELRGLEMADLKSLSIKHTKITDAGLAHIASLKTLMSLDVWYSPITSQGVEQLHDLKELVSVKLYGTKVSPAGATALAEAMPNAKIDRRSGALLGVIASVGGGPCVISTVQPDSAAHKAGILAGDMVAKFDGKPVADFMELTAAIADKIGGDKVVIEVLREGKPVKLNVTLGQWK